MAYEKHIWVDQEIIRDYNLNHIEDGIADEESRAITRENEIAGNITTEKTRATQAEQSLSNAISSETTRATGAEDVITTKLAALQSDFNAEVQRSTQADTDLQSALNDEISRAVEVELSKINSSEKGVANGIATLDGTGIVPESQLPSYVDDVIEGYYNNANGKFYKESAYTTEIVGETGKIYVSLDTNIAYRWSGTVFVPISEPDIATTSKAGIVKPDGTSIKVDNTGTINVNTTFTETTTRANISSGDSLTTIWGKIKKFFTDLKTVAFTGAYSDLSGTPTIPTVNNATLTIQKNGDTVKTFTANASSDVIANITVPTKTSELINNSNFLTSHQDISGKVDKKTTLDTYYGTCSTAAETAAKVVTVTDSASNFSLRAGITITVKFTKTNTASNPTLNVNNTGAKNIWYNTALITTSNLGYAGTANRPMRYVYDGTQWVWIGWSIDSNTTYSTMSIAEMLAGTATTQRSVTAETLNPAVQALSTAYGTCTGQAANQNKVVTIADSNWTLRVGAAIYVKFDANNTYSATASAPVTLNVNSTGAKQIYAANSATPTGTNTTYFGRANYVNQYVYDGTYWVWAGSSADNNTTYSQAGLGQGYGTCSTAAATAEKAVTLSSYALAVNGIVSVRFTYAVPAGATLNINSKGAKPIFYKNAAITAGVIAAGDVATFIYNGTNYYLIAIDRVIGTDAKVTQTATNTNADYEVLFSETADNTTRNESARKYSNLKFNPSTGNLQTTQLNGVTIGSSPKFTDTTYTKMTQTEATTGTATTGRIISAKVLNDTIAIRMGDRTRRDITNDLANLPTAVAEQNLAKYGYAIGDYFTGSSHSMTQETYSNGTVTTSTVSVEFTYHLADMNHEKGTVTPYAITQDHIALLVDTHVTRQWHNGDASTVGYSGSKLHTWLKGDVLNAIKQDMIALFGGSTGLEHLLSNSKLLTTALANWAWQESQYIVAPSEVEVYGSMVWGANGYQTGQQAKKLEIFDKYKWTEILGSEYVWLKDMQAASVACYASRSGSANVSGVVATGFAVGLINFY